jgi:hypothetical protein
MEQSFERSKGIYKSKIPEVAQSIELIEKMKQKADAGDDMITQYSLCDTVYASAKVCSRMSSGLDVKNNVC